MQRGKRAIGCVGIRRLEPRLSGALQQSAAPTGTAKPASGGAREPRAGAGNQSGEVAITIAIDV